MQKIFNNVEPALHDASEVVIDKWFQHPDDIRVCFEHDLYYVQVYIKDEDSWDTMGNGCKTRDYAQDVIDSLILFTEQKQREMDR